MELQLDGARVVWEPSRQIEVEEDLTSHAVITAQAMLTYASEHGKKNERKSEKGRSKEGEGVRDGCVCRDVELKGKRVKQNTIRTEQWQRSGGGRW